MGAGASVGLAAAIHSATEAEMAGTVAALSVANRVKLEDALKGGVGPPVKPLKEQTENGLRISYIPLRDPVSLRPADIKRYISEQPIWDALKQPIGNEANERDVVLLSLEWVIKWARAGKVLPRRQDLPPGAVLTAEAIQQIYEASAEGDSLGRHRYRRGDSAALPVIAISYCWLTFEHPDPRGEQLRYVADVLERERDAYEGYQFMGFSDMGIFWDWSSLFQWHGGGRTEIQEKAFQRGLSTTMDLWYGHKLTTVYMVTELPSGYDNLRSYDMRGWTFFERCSAELIKDSRMAGYNGWEMCLVLGKESTGRRTPLTPSAFAEQLAPKQFTNNADHTSVTLLFEKTATSILSQVEHLSFCAMPMPAGAGPQLGNTLNMCKGLSKLHVCSNDLADDEAAQLCDYLESGSLPALKQLYFTSNNLGDNALQALAQAISRGAMPALTRLWLNDNHEYTSQGLTAIAEVLARGYLPLLQDVELEETEATLDGARAIRAAMRR